jgi:hypothetical protein
MTSIPDYPSTLGGIWLAMQSHFNTKAEIAPVGGWYSLRPSNPVSSMRLSSCAQQDVLTFREGQYLRAANASDLLSTELYFEDPMVDMALMAHELAFRTAYTETSIVPGGVMLGGGVGYNLTSTQSYVSVMVLAAQGCHVFRLMVCSALFRSSRRTSLLFTERLNSELL